MSVYRFTGVYPSHYDTPTGSAWVVPGEHVEWETPPDSNWVAVPAEPDEAAAEDTPRDAASDKPAAEPRASTRSKTKE